MFRRFLLSISIASLAMMAGAAQSQTLFGERSIGKKLFGRNSVERVQYREAESYIDQYGREIIWDPQTGRIVAIVPPGERRYVPPGQRRQLPPAQRRAARQQELRGDRQGRRIPLGERLKRDLEAELGLREPDDQIQTRRRADPDLDPGGGNFPAAPRLPETAPRGQVERQALGEPDAPTDEEPLDDMPLDNDGQMAAVPDETPRAATPQPVQPGVNPSLGGKRASEAVAKIQIVLDRAGLSPGVIDGHMGDNVNKAISAYRDKTGQPLRTYDPVSIETALADTGGDAFAEYTITAVDAAGPYVASVPSDYGEKAKLERLSYSSVAEMLAERFHMDENYLKTLNPGANFDRPGTIIKVVNPGAAVKGKVARIIADKANKQVRGYDAAGRLLVAYPATIGSGDTPSPTGTVTVERVAFDPQYTYNPNVNFKQGENHDVLTIPPGPNGPVGSIWIALSKPTYGIHGTPEPSKIGKTFSHGCVRLTNWDATELAKIVDVGVTVVFAD